MTKILKWLGGGIAAAMLLGLAGLFSGEAAEAQTPPTTPPHRFGGSVSLNGEPAAAGTSVTAVVNGAECGSATVVTSVADSTYAVNVPSSCAAAGDTVSFRIGGYDAAESGEWSSARFTNLALTASSMMPEDPGDGMGMDECPEEGMDGDMNGDAPAEPDEPSEPAEPAEPGEGDMDGDDCPEGEMPEGEPSEPTEPEGEMPEEEMAPEVSDAGTGLATTSTSTSLAALLGVTALAIVLGGYTVARRRR